MAGNSVLAKMAVEISANNAKFAAALSKSQKDLSSFTSGVTKAAAAIGVAFSVREIANFTIEVARLSGEAEAVRKAFERLPESTRLMSDLKQATGGTVSELDLMKRAVQASNFDISLEALPKLLEFATLRAQQTGQSVDYLVDSIVTGIGRKSKLILDNLGISAVQLTEALGGASAASASIGDVAAAVGRIAEKNLKNMEKFSENASTKLQRLAASWENLKVAMGDAANSNGFIGQTTNMLTNFSKALAGEEFTTGFNQLLQSGGRASEILERFARAGGKIDLSWQQLMEQGFVRAEGAARKYEKILAKISETQKNLALAQSATGNAIDPSTGIPTSGLTRWDPSMAAKRIESLDSLKEKEKELNEQFSQTDVTNKAKLKNTADQILAIRAQIKALEDLLKAQETVALSLTAQRALKGDSLKGVSTFGELVTKTTPEGGILQNFEGVAGEKTPLSDAIAVDLDKLDALAAKMLETRNASLEATTEMTQHWVDFSGAIGGAISTIAEGLGGVISGVENLGETVIRAFVGFAKQFGEMLIASGIAALSLQKLITNPAAAIVAGTALIAVAGAASASLQKAHSGLTGGGTGGSTRPNQNQIGVQVEGRISGYNIALNQKKEGYRRSIVG